MCVCVQFWAPCQSYVKLQLTKEVMLVSNTQFSSVIWYKGSAYTLHCHQKVCDFRRRICPLGCEGTCMFMQTVPREVWWQSLPGRGLTVMSLCEFLLLLPAFVCVCVCVWRMWPALCLPVCSTVQSVNDKMVVSLWTGDWEICSLSLYVMQTPTCSFSLAVQWCSTMCVQRCFYHDLFLFRFSQK